MTYEGLQRVLAGLISTGFTILLLVMIGAAVVLILNGAAALSRGMWGRRGRR